MSIIDVDVEKDRHPYVILLVDDEEPILNSLVRLLSRENYQLLTAKNGQEAWQTVQSEPVDLILTDHTMPEMTGTDLLLKTKEEYPDILRLMLTSHQDVDIIKKGINEAGIYHFINKPWNSEELSLTIRRALEYRQAQVTEEKLRIETAILRELSSLKQIGEFLYESGDIKPTLAKTLEQLVSHTRSEGGVIIIKDETFPQGRLYCSFGSLKSQININDSVLKCMESSGESILVSGHHIQPDLPFSIVLSPCPAIITPLLISGKAIGAINIFRSQDTPNFSNVDVELVETLARNIIIALNNNHLKESMRENYFATIKSLATAIEAKDPYTRGHSEKVMFYSLYIAEEMGLSEQENSDIRFAGLLHDIGKIGVPDSILNNTGSLTESDFEEIKKHPQVGAKIISAIPALKHLSPLIEAHHERYDGKGYPYGLKGKKIPLGARILAVADTYESMTSDRSYRKMMEDSKAVEIIKEGINKQFDGKVVKVFLKSFKDGK